MENIRTNKAARAAAMLLVLVLITMCILSGTLAKYITKDQGSDSARVAKFGVVASMSGNLFGDAYTCDGNATHDTFAIAKYGDDTHEGTADEGFAVRAETKSAKIVAPGTYNDKGMTISVKGQPEVATELVSDFSGTEDIYLAKGNYGVMVPVDVKVTEETIGDYYYLDSGAYKKATATQLTGSVQLYKLQDKATLSADYYPLDWTLTGDNVTAVTNGRLSAVKAAIEAVFKGAKNDPNYSYTNNVGTATLAWAWDFNDDYDTAVNPTTSDPDPSYSNDAADTILGDLIVGTMANGKVVMLSEGNYKDVTVDTTTKKATVGSKEVANLEAGVNANLTVKQICIAQPGEIHKGDLVTLDGQTAGDNLANVYRVIKVDGHNVEVMSMTGESKKFNSASKTTTMGGTTVQKYNGSDLDNYLNGTKDGCYYAGLSTSIKNAIVEQNIDQYAYGWSDSVPGGSYWTGSYDFDGETPYYITRPGLSENVGSRKVYALDVADVIAYLGEGNLTAAKVNKLFFDQETAKSACCWLRSAITGSNDRAFSGNGRNGNLDSFSYVRTYEARAAFTIDKTKVDITKVS